MARYLGTAASEQFKGKLGGIVGAGSTRNPYMKAKSVPKNPKSKYQLTVRENLSVISKAWSGLTDLQIKEWNEVATREVRADKRRSYGGKHVLSGKSYFTEINANRLLAGQPLRENRPGIASNPTVKVVSIDFDSLNDTAKVKLSANATTATYVFVGITVALSNGTRNYAGKYKVFAYVPRVVGSDEIDVTTEFKARFGSIPATGNRAAEAKILDDQFGNVAVETLAVNYV